MLGKRDSICACCGRPLDTLLSDYAYRRPLPYFMVPEADRSRRVKANDDVCVVDDKIFVIRGIMNVPITDQPGQTFGWGLWALVSQRSFHRYMELYDVDAPVSEPPFRGLLAVSPPNYPSVLDAEVTVHLGKATQRPELRPVKFDNPFFAELRDGITTQRWHRILVEIEEYQSQRE